MEKSNGSTVLAIFFAAFAVVFIAGLSLLTRTVIYGQPSEPSSHACPFGGEVQEGQFVDEPEEECPPGGLFLNRRA